MRSRLPLLAFAAIAACTGPSSGPPGCRSPQESAECFVADFYQWYGPGSKDINDVVPERGRDLAPRLREALANERWVQDFFPGDEVGLSFDPFINGQDWCGTFAPATAESRGDTTLVPVYETCGGKRGDAPRLTAEVVRSAGRYQLANLRFPGGSPKFADLLTILAAVRQEQLGYFYATGGCPFECCRYGDWTLETDVALLAFPRADSISRRDTVGVLRAGLKVRADSGIVLMTPPGIAVVTDGSALQFDTPERLTIPTGDTLYLLNHLGEGHRNIRWRDTIFSMDTPWDSTGARGARLVRPPRSSWWVHFTDGSRKGWVEMTRRVRVKGSDACG
jgi:hypothetical protein